MLWNSNKGAFTAVDLFRSKTLLKLALNKKFLNKMFFRNSEYKFQFFHCKDIQWALKCRQEKLNKKVLLIIHGITLLG